jgi:hypothetical protein
MGAGLISKKSGPFFRTNPRQTWRGNIRRLMERTADVMAQDVAEGFRQGAEGRAPVSRIGGRVADRVKGRTVSRVGKRWQVTAVVSVDTADLDRREAVAVMAAASLLEGRQHPFRRSTGRLRRVKRMLQDELLDGLA